jgi:hypothetical protein
MRKLLVSAIFGTIVICSSFAEPKFVTPAMMKRNGLTDEQYQLLWKQGKNPQIDVATARDWIFRSSRYTNVVEWLEICGKTNDFAKLSHKLQGDNFALIKTNGVLAALVSEWKKNAEGWQASAEDWMNAATNNAARVERVSAALDEKRAEYVEKRDKSNLPTTKAIYQAFIDAVDKIKERLEVKDGGN